MFTRIVWIVPVYAYMNPNFRGPYLQGVKAVIAESFERIHRSNLVGMGILPLQFLEGQSADTLKLTGNSHSFSDVAVCTPEWLACMWSPLLCLAFGGTLICFMGMWCARFFTCYCCCFLFYCSFDTTPGFSSYGALLLLVLHRAGAL